MTRAPTYNRQFNFTNYQASNPDTPLPASQVDAELNAIKITLDALLQNLSLIQRTDGALANQSVGLAQVTPALAVGFAAPLTAEWSPNALYTQGQTVFYGQILYIATTTTSVQSATPPSSDTANWSLLADFSTIYGFSLPVSEPVTVGVTWNNGGVVCVT